MSLQDFFTRFSGAVSQTEFARRLGVSSVVVSQWKTGKRPVPVGRCPSIEALTDGLVLCEELRPDIDWAVLRKSVVKVPPSP